MLINNGTAISYGITVANPFSANKNSYSFLTFLNAEEIWHHI